MSNRDEANHHQQPEWIASCSSQNLATVLNDPRVDRGDISNFFTRHWGEEFVETVQIPVLDHLQRIRWNTFRECLRTITVRYKRHLKDKQRASRLRFRQNASAVADLQDTSEVPEVFFLSSFSIEDPQCFNALLSLGDLSSSGKRGSVSKLTSPPSSLKRRPGARGNLINKESLQLYKIVQERLTYYLDLVEMKLARQISARSPSLFAAMTFHDELQKLLSTAESEVRHLRSIMQKTDDEFASQLLRLVSLQKSHLEHKKVLKKLELMRTVSRARETVQNLIDSSDYLAALELIWTTRSVLSEELNGVVCFRHLKQQLDGFEKEVGGRLQEELKQFVTEHFAAGCYEESFTDLEKDKLACLLLGLCRAAQEVIFQTITNEAVCSVKSAVRQVIAKRLKERDGADLSPGESSRRLADEMRKLDFGKWLLIYADVLRAVVRFCSKIKELLAVVKAVGEFAERQVSPSTLSGSELANASSASEEKPCEISVLFFTEGFAIFDFDAEAFRCGQTECLQKISSFSVERCFRVMSAKFKDHFSERFEYDDFKRLIDLVSRFDEQYVELCAADSTVCSLRASMQNTVTIGFLRGFHQERMTKLTNIIDSENWKQAEVPQLFQNIIDNYEITGRLEDVPLMKDRLRGNQPSTRTHLTFGTKQYAVVGTVLILLQIVAQYCGFVNDVPSIAADLLPSLVDILKIFNSRTCQLILGAGALQMVGLKTITSRMLALCCRCLQLVVALTEVVQELFASCLSSSQKHLMRHFSQVLKDYNDHIGEVLTQLYSLVEPHMRECFNKWMENGFHSSSPFQQLCKQLTRFAEKLQDVLEANDLLYVFRHIRENFEKILLSQLTDLRNGAKEEGDTTARCAYAEFVKCTQDLKSLPCFADVCDIPYSVLP